MLGVTDVAERLSASQGTTPRLFISDVYSTLKMEAAYAPETSATLTTSTWYRLSIMNVIAASQRSGLSLQLWLKNQFLTALVTKNCKNACNYFCCVLFSLFMVVVNI
jgi:hypothetical protein